MLSARCFAQTDNSNTLSFQDSVRVALENTKGIDASAIGASFGNAWINLSPEQQAMVKKQARMMKKKGYKLQPHFVNYYGVLVAALDVHKIEPAQLEDYLEVAGKTIQKSNPNQANIFFQQCRDFFIHHALAFEKFFKLYASDDDFSFDYLEPTTPVVDTTQAYSPPPADTTTASLPAWQQPIVQPDVYGPVIVFNRVSLNFVTPYDSAFLKNTKGTYSLRDRLFVGDGGSFDWSPAGLGSDSVFYELKKYHFKTNQPSFKAVQGNLTYRGKLASRVPGILEFKSINHKLKKAAVYPRFKSYESNISMAGLGSDSLKYTGGFGMLGASVTSQNVNNDPATIEVSGRSEKKFKAQSLSFTFKDSVIISNNTRITIYQGAYDSITHPSMQMSFDFKNQVLQLSKDNTNLKKAPFASSYFGVDFSADNIRWNLKTDSMSLSIQGSAHIAPMVIESHDFYDPEDYRLLRGQGFNFHPLALVVNYANKINSPDFSVFELVEPNKSLNTVRMAADFLAQKGAIDYDSRSGKIHVKEKSMHLVEAVKGKVDYDNLKIHSLIDTVANASINLKKNTMTVWGVEEFKVSDSLKVRVKPDSSIIQFLKNRNIKFKGTIDAGNFEITGKNFLFKYDSFAVDLKQIDSIRFYVTEKDGSRRRVNNSMVGTDSTAAAAGGLQASNKTSGTLYINHPDNKSGRVKYSHYPNLDASAGGVIYFNRQEILNGAYDQSIFFVVPPFKLDSLNDADPAAINFEGTFVSNNMFPSFKEKLHTMPDNSLGFTHAIPTSGYDLFGGPGKMHGGLSLDHDGIRGVGRIDYLAATVESKDFVFYQDSVLGKGSVGDIKEMQIGSVKFPHVQIKDFQLKWFPKQDKFKLKNTKDPFSLYKNTATLNGVATVSKTGVTGSGWLTTRGSEAFSRELTFNTDDFRARHARFDVKTGNPDKPALQGKDVRLEFDLQKNYATISPEIEGVAAIDFPYAQFKTSITKAVWDLNTQKIQMTKAADVPLENSYFYTTRKDLDSLSFNAEKAEYNIRSGELKVSGIPYIIVADAKITPDHNEVLILENAKIGQLKNTVIVLDTINGYHRLTEGVVDIVSRKEFSGYATYQYVNAANDTFAIKMTDFHLEQIADDAKKKRKKVAAAMQTVANGAVDPAEKLLVAPRIFYKGEMTMYATRPALQLKGFVKLDLRKIKGYDTWIAYNQSGDEKEIYLDFDNSITEGGGKAKAGLHFASDNSLYITFIFDKKDESDDDFFLPSGSLFFDKESGEFKIEDRQKAAGEKLSGKIFNYNEEKQEVKFEGPVNFFKNFKDFNLKASAIGSGNLESNEIKLNSLMMLDMGIPAAAYQMMALKLQDVIKNEVANEALGDQAELLYKIANITDERTAKDYETKSQQGYVSLATIPQLGAPIVFPNVNLKWSQDKKAFYSEGVIGVSNIGRTDINGGFEGFMEIRRNEDGTPAFHVFFKASPEAWYYFGYEDNRLMIHSSDPGFNDLITKKSNASKAKAGELIFIPGSDDETLAWINKFRLNYYNLEAPYDLTGGASAAKKKEKKKDDKEDDGF